jgi:transposase
LKTQAVWDEWLGQLGDHPAAKQLQVLWIGLDANRRQCRLAHRAMVLAAKTYPVVAAWQDLPGIGPVRAITLLAYLDTPWRFAGPKKLWKYCGVGLQCKASGSDRRGRPKPGSLKLAYRVNRRLKEAVVGGAWSAIMQKDNVFARHYERMHQKGIHGANAWHAVARKLLTVMWGMWKSDSRFQEALVCH